MDFFPLPPDESLREYRRLYALIDHIEPEQPDKGEPCDVFFDCVGANWVDWQSGNSGSRWNIGSVAEAPTSILHLPTRAGDDEFTRDPGYMGRWIELRLGDTGPTVEHYASIDHEGLKTCLESHRPIEAVLEAGLNTLTSLDQLPDASLAELNSVLPSVRQPACVAVYDLGQGNCNAICGEIGAPLIYFDFGGGVLSNARTYPPRIAFCYSQRPTIILSHWDWDHWASGWRDPLSHGMKWIAPRQKIGVNHAKFAAKLSAKGNLLIWPESLAMLSTEFGFVQRCSGTNRNDSGLAVLVQSDWPGASDGEREWILLPGDARYSKIPMTKSGRLRGLVASHHGGRMKGEGVPHPVAQVGHGIVYSYGDGNSFGHPFDESRTIHQSAGWEIKAMTAAYEGEPRGHVGLGSCSWRRIGCNGSSCTLAVTKVPNVHRSKEAIEDIEAFIKKCCDE